MRKIICFVVASGLVVGGIYLFAVLWVAPGPIKILYFTGPALMMAAGAAWLWGDYIRPLLGLSSTDQ